MNYASKSRPHLVERAAEALGLVRPAPVTTLEQTQASASPAAAVAEATLPEVAEAPGMAAQSPPPTVIEALALQRAGLLVGLGTTTRSRVSEEMSLIQNQVLRAIRMAEPVEGRCPRVILVTSARPGEGKSFVSLNIAASIAVSGEVPVLLVDTDGKRGSLSELLGVSEEPGLRLLASGSGARRAELLPLPTAQPRLSFLSHGAAVPGQPQQPPSPMVAGAILRLAKALPEHVIILDSPPCLSTSDPAGLAAIAGQVLMVVQAERTQRTELEAALDLVDACPVLQLVLNQTRMVSNDSFGSYGSYGGEYGAPAGPG